MPRIVLVRTFVSQYDSTFLIAFPAYAWYTNNGVEGSYLVIFYTTTWVFEV